MIHGIGSDIVTIKRIEDALEKHGDRFVQRILCPDEVVEFAASAPPAPADALAGKSTDTTTSKRLARFVAKRFAVKEAFSKAFGTGIGGEVGWHDVAVKHTDKGRPLLAVSDAMQQKFDAQKIGATHVSIADETEHAIAYVILEKV